MIPSAGFRIPIRNMLSRDIVGMVQDGWAGQYILGPIFQPSMFGVLLLCAMRWFLEKRWIPCVVGMTLAAAMHPSYVLISGMLAIGLTVSLIVQRRWRVTAFMLVGNVAMIVPLAIHLKYAFAPTTPEVYQRAQDILTFERIPHHMLISRFFKSAAILQIVWVVVAIVLARKSKLMLPLAIVFGLAILLTLVAAAGTGQLPTRVREIQPWRATAWAIPVATAVIPAYTASWLAKLAEGRVRVYRVAGVAIALCVLGGVVMEIRIFRMERKLDYYGVMQHVRANHKPGELYVVPTDFMKFRLQTEAATYVTYKSHPNKDVELLKWHDRYTKAEAFYNATDDATRAAALAALLADHPTHLVVPAKWPLDRPELEMAWENKNFVLYHVK